MREAIREGMREGIRGDEEQIDGGKGFQARAVFISTHQYSSALISPQAPGDDDVIIRTTGKELERGACAEPCSEDENFPRTFRGGSEYENFLPLVLHNHPAASPAASPAAAAGDAGCLRRGGGLHG